jgi:CubicO group peptidase (beta-lactamase class C family)
MALHPAKPTRRAVLAGLGGLALADPALAAARQPEPPGEPSHAFENKIPVSGKAGPGLEAFDEAIIQIMEHHGVPGAALTITRNGKLVLAKGYGWANASTGVPVKPDTLFGLASLSKAITAVAVLKLAEQGKLDLDAPVFGLLKHIKPPQGARTDPRLARVTVRQCLNHSGGWDRAVNGDPVNWEPQICRALRLRPPLTPTHFLSFTLSMPLDFDPGTEAKYSNVGYVALGEVVAKASGQAYHTFVAEQVLKPMGIKRSALHPAAGKYLVGEAIRHLAGTLVALPPMRLPMVDAAGGWTGSAVDVARFLTNLDGSRGTPVLGEKARVWMLEAPPAPLKPRADGSHFGLGWDSVNVEGKTVGYAKDGSYQGMRTFMKRLPTGVNWALLYNASMDFDPQDMQIASRTVHEVRQLVEKFDKYPDTDLFDEFA